MRDGEGGERDTVSNSVSALSLSCLRKEWEDCANRRDGIGRRPRKLCRGTTGGRVRGGRPGESPADVGRKERRTGERKVGG